MLQFMRKHAKFFYVFFFIIIISFIFFYVGPVDKSTTVPVAEIGKEKITVEEYWRAYERALRTYRDIYKEKFNDEMEKTLKIKEEVLNALIEEKVLLLAARDIGITVSDEELKDAIINEPSFMRNGVFDREVYLRTLQLNRLSPETFENAKRRELTVVKTKMLIAESVDLTDNELNKIPGDEQIAKAFRQAILFEKKEKAVKSYVNGIKKELSITIHTQLIS